MINTPALLYVEDEENHTFLFRRSLRAEGLEGTLRTAPDADTAVNYLEGRDQYSDRREYPLPHVLLLDLHLPGASGLELLAWVRRKKSLPQPIVIMLTSSSSDNDIAAAYALGANGFVTKSVEPAGLAAFVAGLRTILFSKRAADGWLTFEGNQALPSEQNSQASLAFVRT
jgi:DNA-binding response OmpR family regulator